MNKIPRFRKITVVLISLIMVLVSLGLQNIQTIDSHENDVFTDETEPAAAVETGTRAGSPRTVLVELLTNTGCTPCADANPPLNELCDVYGPEQVVVVAYHWDFPDPSDPFYSFNPTENDDRIETYYGANSVPRAIFDGTITRTGVSGGTTGMYTTYKADIETRLAVASPVTITLDGYLDVGFVSGNVNISIQVTDSLPVGSLVVRTAVTEDNRYYEGGNGEVRHRNVMRDMLPDESLPGLVSGQYYNFSRPFNVDMSYNPDNLQVVVFLQNDNDKSVLQAAMYDLIPQKVLVVDDDQSTNPDGDEDAYQEVLTYMDHAFDSHVYNEVGSPPSTLLDDYEVVIWICARTSSNTLTAADQTAISTFLDGGRGSLFMNGQNIGSDIGGSAFYQNYLHATFVAPDTNELEIAGIPEDPISEPFPVLPISDDSPSEIAPIAPATTTFTYASSKKPAAIKADHDFDSKVVYFAFMYFEDIDIIDSKAMVMMSVLSWLTDASNKIRLYPGWNLISIPLELPDPSLAAALDSLSGQYNCVSYYDSFDDDWKNYVEAKPASMNDLIDIFNFMGFYIHITTPGETFFAYTGMEPWEDQIVHLYPGWNLVGYPSLVEWNRTTGLNNLAYGIDVLSVQTYVASTGQWVELGPTDYFVLGCGYWIYSVAEQDWIVPLV